MISKLKNYKIERNRRIKSIKTFDKKAITEWNLILNNLKLIRYKNQLQKYFTFLKNLKFKHQNYEAYFSHPLRVACLCHNFTKLTNYPKFC